MDTLGKVMYLAFCNLNGYPSKLFLVEDLDTGLDILVRQDLSYIITGGVVTACGPLALEAVVGVPEEQPPINDPAPYTTISYEY